MKRGPAREAAGVPTVLPAKQGESKVGSGSSRVLERSTRWDDY